MAIFPLQAAQARAAATPSKTTCTACHLRDQCLPCGMVGQDVLRLDSLMFGQRKIKAGETLYRQGDAFKFIYTSRGGMFKSSMGLSDGREQISGFHMAGEQFGLDGVAKGQYGTTASALEDTQVCAIPYASLVDKMASSPGTQNLVSRLMGREIMQQHGLMVLLGSMNAEERLATFLLNLAGRLKARGYSAREFNLRMSRAEIGSHLGLKLETVSRAFSSFQEQGLLEVAARHIKIVDLAGLKRIFEAPIH